MWRSSVACYRVLTTIHRPVVARAASQSIYSFQQRSAVCGDRIPRPFSAACMLRTESSIDRERRRQQTQDDEREDIAEHARQSIDIEEHRKAEDKDGELEDFAPEIERLDPQSVPELYPEFTVEEQSEWQMEEYSQDQEQRQTEEEEDAAAEGGDSWYVDPSFAQVEEKGDVPLWQQRAAENLARPRVDVSEFANGSVFDMCCAVLKADAEIKVVDVADRCEWTSRMVVAEAKSVRHMRAMAETLLRAIKDRNRQRNIESTTRVDGRESDDWVVVDMGHFVVHIMTPEARRLYDLEGLWSSRLQLVEEAEEQADAESEEGREGAEEEQAEANKDGDPKQ
ncbi:hypothetical protein IWW48_003342 [Coemansia sp. RSA 1200]|nr:hypothetical protein IWW48_003342 [Coemansia sp. RSA 1200]